MSGWLIDTLLYTGLLIALVLVLRRPVGRYFGPQFAYSLWALPFLRLLLPPIVLPASLRPAPELVASTAMPLEWIDAEPAAFPFEPASALSAAPASEWPGLTDLVLAVWIAGALAFLAWRVVTYRRMRRELLTEARPVGEAGRIRLIETPALVAPVAFGVIDKVIALPPLFMAQSDIAARDLVIAHELAHHHGHDLSANFAAQAVLALHWFNPLAWIGWRAMRRDQEAACDARVLGGKGHEERVRYAALIADAAAGPRLALAAPMACPMLGDKSIIHRLRSLARAEPSARRRWLGRCLVAAGAFALPLTASISYAQIPEPPAPPAATEASRQTPSVASGANEPGFRHFVHGSEEGAPVPPRPHDRSSLGADDVAPMPSPAVRFEFPWGDPGDSDFEENMEEWGRQMGQWGEDYGRQREQWGEEWGEAYGAQVQAQVQAKVEAQARRAQTQAEAKARRAQARAWANAARSAPEVVQSCDKDELRRTTTADGRPRVVICPRDTLQMARSSLRSARNSIARNPAMGEDVRSAVLADLDEELERIEHDPE